MSWEIRESDCVEAMAAMDEASVDAVVCDPPYGLEFMGKEWDRLSVARANRGTQPARKRPPGESGESQKFQLPAPAFDLSPSSQRAMQDWHEAWAREALRVLKPGGHLLAFGGTRTFHRLTVAIEDAGFEIRDCLSWMYGSGFPKSLNVAVAIDKAHGAPDRGRAVPTASTHLPNGKYAEEKLTPNPVGPYEPQSNDAARWQGWGTALKPSWEPIIMARKQLSSTVAANVLAHGAGALNVDGCRIGMGDEYDPAKRQRQQSSEGTVRFASAGLIGSDIPTYNAAGRWPANTVLSHSEGCVLVGERRVATGVAKRGNGVTGWGTHSPGTPDCGYADEDGMETVEAWECVESCPVRLLDEQSGASRFFYTAKASKAERGPGNNHPTVKPIELMRWLVRLVTPPDGLVFDPFAGSGTTGIAALREGFSFIGIEREPDYVQIARNRIRNDEPLFNAALEVAA